MDRKTSLLGSRLAPKFKHELWNCYEEAREELPKTNNSVEGWHYAFENQICASHPSIWKFIEGLKREQSLQEMKIAQYLSGTPIPSTKKKYRDSSKRLQSIVSNYSETIDLPEYLSNISYNVCL